MEKPREIAFQVLCGHKATDVFIELALHNALKRTHLKANDRSLCQEIVYGVLRWRRTLDWLVSQRAKRNIPTIKVRSILQIGLYQLFWLDRIPQHAIVNEAVSAANKHCSSKEAGFINAVLRGYCRSQISTKKALEDLKRTAIDVGYSQPRWLIDKWTTRWGAQSTKELLEWNNQPAKNYARVNRLLFSPEDVLQAWAIEGVQSTPVATNWCEPGEIFEFGAPKPIDQLDSFTKGMFYLQDPSTLLAPTMLQAKPGEKILDLCAAPGGKTVFIAQNLKNQGRIHAQDEDVLRLDLVEENCKRLGVTIVETSRPDRTLNPSLSVQFDRILVDAPCSNTGVLRRRIDLRWRISPSEISRLTETQRNLLNHAAIQLRPGGSLVYSTCSLEEEENEAIIHEFLAKHSDFSMESSRQLTPFTDRVDGAFVALLIKSK